MRIFDKFDRCFQENLETGFCKEGEPCRGEYLYHDKIMVKCLRCPYLDAKTARKDFLK